MDSPLISVIVLCFNEKDFIEKCIISILNQTIPPEKTEIFVVDGMSSDGTRDILFRLQKEYNRFEILDNIKQKTPFAWNMGIKKSKGKYIAIHGAHTVYRPDYLANSLELFEVHPDISCAGGPIESVGLKSFGRAAAISMSHPLGVGNAKHRFPDYEGYAEGACFPVYKREVFDKVGMFDEWLIRNQDDEFNFRMKKSGLKVFLSPTAKCTYYVRETPSALFKQYFDYGYWRMAVIKKHRLPMSPRQIIPVLFLLVIVFSIIISPFLKINPFFTIFSLPVLYLLILSAAAIPVLFRKGIKTSSLFVISTIILHFSYGFGFIKGIFKFGFGENKGISSGNSHL